MRGVVPADGADVVHLELRNKTGAVVAGSARIAKGGAVEFSLPAGGEARLLLVRQLPRRVRTLGPATATLEIDGGGSQTVTVPGAEVVGDLSVVVGSNAGFVAQLARGRNVLTGRAVLLTPERMPATWLVLRGVNTLFVRAGALPALASRATAMGIRVCRLAGERLACARGVPRKSQRRYPAEPSVREGMRKLGVFVPAGVLWLLMLAFAVRYRRRYWGGVVALLVPVFLTVIVPRSRVAPAFVRAEGHMYLSKGDTSVFFVARVRAVRGLASTMPVVGPGELWMRPDSSDARRGELREFHPPTRGKRFVDERIWQMEGFAAKPATTKGWRFFLERVVLAKGGS